MRADDEDDDVIDRDVSLTCDSKLKCLQSQMLNHFPCRKNYTISEKPSGDKHPAVARWLHTQTHTHLSLVTILFLSDMMGLTVASARWVSHKHQSLMLTVVLATGLTHRKTHFYGR